MISKFVKRLMNASPEEIRSIDFKKHKKIYASADNYSEEELIDFLVRRDIRTTGQLKKAKGRKPTLYIFKKVFGSWNNAKRAAFGEEPKKVIGDPPTDLGYIIKIIHEYNIKEVMEYIKLRKKKPDIVPSSYHLYKFGGFTKVKKISELYTVGDHLEEYAKFKRRLGRIPSPKECREQHIAIDELLEYFVSKRKLNDFIDGVERASDEKSKGN